MGKVLVEKVVFPPSGKYVLAISGGMDSVCLLHIMSTAARIKGYQLVVAHFDHGMRPDSVADSNFVQQLAIQYELKFSGARKRLGFGATEATARTARYKFLKDIQKKCSARGILTAHHFDDVLETAIFNAGRGADDLGLTPMHLAEEPIRPLLALRKAELAQYASKRQLTWREDPTNQDLSITRNFIRHKVVPLLSKQEIARVGKLAEKNQKIYRIAHAALSKYAEISSDSIQLSRTRLLTLDNDQITLLVKVMMRQLKTGLPTMQLHRLINFMKIGTKSSHFQINAKLLAHIGDDMITLTKNS